MAMLLAMFQKMRLTREYNRETLNLTRFSHKVDRIAKSIKNIQKMYAAKIKLIEMSGKNQLSIFKALNMRNSGLSDNSYLNSLMGENSIWEAYKNGDNVFTANEDGTYGKGGFEKSDIDAFQTAMTNAQNQVSQRNMQVQMQNSNYEQQITMSIEAAKEQMEMEQDMALEPLEYEQTMMELDKEASEERCQRLKAEIESYDQLLKEETKNAAPKFGLG